MNPIVTIGFQVAALIHLLHFLPEISPIQLNCYQLRHNKRSRKNIMRSKVQSHLRLYPILLEIDLQFLGFGILEKYGLGS